jgi:hypothetical protein
MPDLPFDPAAPPPEPPEDADPLLWRAGLLLHCDHQRDPLTDQCQAVTCQRLHRNWPCPGHNMARTLLLKAVGIKPTRPLWALTNAPGNAKWES